MNFIWFIDEKLFDIFNSQHAVMYNVTTSIRTSWYSLKCYHGLSPVKCDVIITSSAAMTIKFILSGYTIPRVFNSCFKHALYSWRIEEIVCVFFWTQFTVFCENVQDLPSTRVKLLRVCILDVLSTSSGNYGLMTLASLRYINTFAHSPVQLSSKVDDKSTLTDL